MVVISLFDSTGTWASFAPAGAEVIAVDMTPKPLTWSRTRGVQHIQARIVPDPASDAEELRIEPGDLTLARALTDLPRPDVLIMAPPCQALARQRHIVGRQEGRTGPRPATMTTELGLALVRWCVAYATATRPRVWVLENPAGSLAWTVVQRRQIVKLGWWGFAAEKPTGLGGDFEVVVPPSPLPVIDPTNGGTRPSGAIKGRGGVQAMPSYLRSRTPADFAAAWWAAQASRW